MYSKGLLGTYAGTFSSVQTVADVYGKGARAAIIDSLESAEAAGEKIVVHCNASGKGRTGNVLALWLHHVNLCERRGFLLRLPVHAAAYGDDAAAAGTDGEAFCVNLCERRAFLLQLPAAALGDNGACCSGGACGHATFLLL